MKKWLQNKGFSLVELIITIAILSVVGGSVTAFVLVAQRNYQRGTSETQLQYEAQVVVNRLNDLVMDCAKGISYTYVGVLEDGTLVEGNILGDEDEELKNLESVSSKSVFIYDTDMIYKVSWEKEESKLYISTYDINGVLLEDNLLLADYVTGFYVDLNDMVESRVVSFSLELSKGEGRGFQTEHRIKLRNDVLVNAQTTEVYEEEFLPVEPTNIQLTPDRVYVWGKDAQLPSEEVTINALVYNIFGGEVSQYVSWKIDGLDLLEGSSLLRSDMETVAAGIGRLNLDLEEAKKDADKSFYVSARKILSDGSVLESDNQTLVYIRDISGISVTKDLNTGKLKPGNSLNMQASLSGSNLVNSAGTPLSIAELGGVSISISVKNEANEYVDYNNYFTITNWDENNGRLSLNVKNPIAEKNLMAYFTFAPKRSGYTQMSTTICMNLNSDFFIEGLDEVLGWIRETTVIFNLSDMPNTTGGYTDNQGRYVLPVRFIFRSYDSNRKMNNLLSEEYHANNSGPTGDHGNVYLYQDYVHQLDGIRVFLRHKEDLALAFPYYALEYYLFTYKSGSADKMEITVINDATQSSYVRTVDIGQPSMGFNQFKIQMIEEAGSVLQDDWQYQDNCHIYLTTDKEEISFYYALVNGWSKVNKNYTTNIRHFFGYVGAYEDENRFDSDASATLFFNVRGNNVIDTGSNYESEVICEGEGIYKVRFVFASDENPKVGDQVTIRYEMNPCFGAGGAPSGYEELFASIKGVPGSVILHFVDKNLQINNSALARPSMEYCPTPTQLEELGKLVGDCYYIAENERFMISSQGGDNKVIYQIYENGKWINPWSNVILRWNGNKWVTVIQ